MNENFDAEKIYDEQVGPLVDKIFDICRDNEIPVFMTFLYLRNDDDEAFCTTTTSTKERQPARFNFLYKIMKVNEQ